MSRDDNAKQSREQRAWALTNTVRTSTPPGSVAELPLLRVRRSRRGWWRGVVFVSGAGDEDGDPERLESADTARGLLLRATARGRRVGEAEVLAGAWVGGGSAIVSGGGGYIGAEATSFAPNM